MRRSAIKAGLLMAAGLANGCVDRHYVIMSDPPGALVMRNGRNIGTTPCDDSYVYYGKYHFTLVKDGYETLQVEEDFKAPWYEYPPLDFFAENIWPFKIRDVRQPSYQLQPLRQVRHDDVLNRANELRARGQTLVPFNPESVPNRQGKPGQQPSATQPPTIGPIVTPAPRTEPAPVAVPPVSGQAIPAPPSGISSLPAVGPRTTP